uniref:NADH dehydrogenase [ubiquinone] 1 beta subcomplex subunit 7 n=1 Tax=Panstrongylus lignarius TaxID=156445 RepID=A0A224XPG4_9HEMI
MGNAVTGYNYTLHKDVVPSPHQESKFEPLYGFPNGRTEKVMIATEEEMYSAKIPLNKRDYCAHHLLKFQKCRKEKFPWIYKCHHEKHEYLHCQYEEFVDRMKDFEREKRLMEREKRLGRTSG